MAIDAARLYSATVRFALLVGLLAAARTSLHAQTSVPSAPIPSSETRWFLRDWTRVESWHYFTPHTGGGDPDYTDVANRLQVGVERRLPRFDAAFAVQYVQFGGLPARASGPGPLGTGALYFDQSARTDSHQIYLRYLNFRFKSVIPGLDVQFGRFGYTSGAESASGEPKIETVKRLRLDSRLLGEFEWALYQRAFDGVRADLDRPRWHVTGGLFRPTQGGFENAAGADMESVVQIGGRLAGKAASPRQTADARHGMTAVIPLGRETR